MTDHRSFITGILQDLEGNAVMGVATGRTPRGKLEIRDYTWFRYPEQLDDMVAFAEARRAGDQRNVYISPLIYGDQVPIDKDSGDPRPMDRHGRPQFARSIANALWSHTIYMDSDSCPPDAFRIPPSRHVNTSRTHGHDYWFLAEPIPAQQAAEIAHRITTAHREEGTDPSGWSANKLLRMPTVNTSYNEDDPYPITWYDSGEVYDWSDISGAYDDVNVDATPVGIVVDTAKPAPPIVGLPDFMELVNRIPSTERRLNDLIYKTPKTGDKGWRSEQLHALCLDLIRFGFSDEEALAIAWHAPTSSKYREDERGVAGVWHEIQRAKAIVTAEQVTREAAMDEPAPPVSHLLERKRRILPLITDDEQKILEHYSNWHTEYLEWAKTKVPVFNQPYHSMDGLVVLGTAFGELGYIPKPSGPMPVNFYCFILGGSSSGKTEAIGLQWKCVRIIRKYDDPDLGANMSESALIERLLERDKKVSVIWTDEADGILANLKQGGWTTGVQATYTKIYDGPVPQMGRVGRKDLRIQDATTVAYMQFMGTEQGMFETLDRGMFKTGFLARPIWVVGDDIAPTKESMKTRQVVEDHEAVYDAMPRYWSSRFVHMREKLMRSAKAGQSQVPILFTEEALEIYDRAKWAIVEHFAHTDDPEIFKTASRRLVDSIWKVSALIAMSEGSQWISVNHLLYVLKLAETWIDDLIYIANGISASQFSRACDEVERFIATRSGGRVHQSEIFHFRRQEAPDVTMRILESLIKQRRVVEEGIDGRHDKNYFINPNRRAAA